MSSARAVLFDIDGTLLVTGGAGAVAWQRAFRESHGIDADIEEHTHAGMTDPEIAEIVFREVIGRDGSEAERAAAIAGYLSHLADAVEESTGYRVMPGIEDAADAPGRRGRPARHRHRQHRIGRPHQARPRRPQPLLRLRRLRLRLPRPHRADQEGARARAARSPAPRSTRPPRSRSATPRATSAPATAPGSGSSASRPAATRSRSSAEAGADWALETVESGFPS